MSPRSLPDIVRAFNALPRAPRTPSGMKLNHWHFSIRRLPLPPFLHVVVLTQPDSHFINTSRPIEAEIEKALGESIDFENEATTLTIVRLILQGFVNRVPTATGRPWSWCAEDEAMAGRIIETMRSLNVDKAHLDMPVASPEQNASSQEEWEGIMRKLRAVVAAVNGL